MTAPIVLTVAGLLLAVAPGGVDLDLNAESVRELIEVTLAVVLFTVASSIGLRWFATNAALGTSIIEDERIPLGFRRVINVESGLNDGLATPIVAFLGLLLGFSVWFVFGAGVLAKVVELVTWQMVAYAVLSLTVLRMVPVAVPAIGLRLPWETVALAGWPGPRGLASIVFAILAFDDIGGEQGTLVLVVVAVTVAMSALAHGISAGPLATWFTGRHPVVDEAVSDPGPS